MNHAFTTMEITACRIHLLLLWQLNEYQAQAELLDQRMMRLRKEICDLAKCFTDGSLPAAEESQAIVNANDVIMDVEGAIKRGIVEDLKRKYP